MSFIVGFGFILFDVITGILKSWYKGSINSTCLRKGMIHKTTEVIVIFGGWALDCLADEYFLVEVPNFLIAFTSYICIMECISIIENLCEINPKLEKLLKPYLEKLQETEENKK